MTSGNNTHHRVSFHSQINNNSTNPSSTPRSETDHIENPNRINNLRLRIDLDIAETTNNACSSSALMSIDGSDDDSVLSKSEFLTRQEVLRRRSRRLEKLEKVYREYYWTLMDVLKLRHREYYWEYGKSPFEEDEDRENLNRDKCAQEITESGDELGLRFGVNNAARCEVHGCKSKAMALTKFCHMHILSDAKQKLYKGCNYAIKSSQTGPIFCGKPILRSAVPSLCPLHFQKAEKHVARALKKVGLNVTSPSKLAPKFHVIIAEYVRQIQTKRRAAQKKASMEDTEIKEEDNNL